MKDISEMSKTELIKLILKINPAETEKRLKWLPMDVLRGHIVGYRRYNEHARHVTID